MLNYTSKIQQFLISHKKHTKYIIILLLLSAFVVSFVCSALTEPAISMTEQSYGFNDNIELLADGEQTDGLPVINGSYSESQFKDYIKWDDTTSAEGRLLGSAHNFALFAFEEITIKTPCYGNLASKKLNVNANFGLEAIATAGGQSITIATEEFTPGGGAQSKNTVLLVPQAVNFYDERGNPVTINPIPKVLIEQADGTTQNFEKGNIDVYAYHVTSDFINFTNEKNQFIALQKWLVAQGSNDENSIINLDDTNIITRDQSNIDQFRQIKIDNKGVNYLNIDYKNLPTDSKSLDLYLAKDAAVIINVDCKDVTEKINTSFQFREYQNGNEIGNDSEAYLKGTNVLWNFYNSSDTTNLQFEKEIQMGNSASGIILAPSSDVFLNSQHTGGVVANKIETSATFTKAMFMTTMESFSSSSIAIMAKKNWKNNEIPENASVQVELYKSNTPNVDVNNLNDGVKVGDTLTLNAANHWNDTWFDLDMSQDYYYYVKELPVSVTVDNTNKFYKATYTNNGRNTTGTVDIENSEIEIQSGGGDPENPDNPEPEKPKIDITVEIKSNPTNLFENAEKTDGKNINLYRTTIPNLTVDELPTGDDIDAATGKILEANGSKFPADMELILGHEENGKNKSYFITENENWQHTFAGLDVFDENNKPYYYYAKETWNQTNSGVRYENVYLGNGASFTNSTITMYAIKCININVKKVWQDSNGGILNDTPGLVKFEIWRSYTQQQSIPWDAQCVWTGELNSGNSWSATVTSLPISDINNNTYYYYIKETEIENDSSKLNEYDISYSTNDPIYSDRANDSHSITESNITITNKKKAEDKISITVKKDMRGKDNDYWNDQTFEFTLYQGNAPDNMWSLGQTYQLTKSNNWEITINDLLKENNGQPYYYRVDETNTPDTFVDSYSTEALDANSVNGNGTIWIYNNPKQVSLKIQKIWSNINTSLIEYVKIRAFKIPEDEYINMQANAIALDMGFDDYLDMLDDNSTPTINGNTATYTDLSFVPVTASDYNHEIRVDLSQFAGNTLSNFKIVFNSNAPIFSPEGQSGTPNHYIILGNGGKQGLWDQNALNSNYYMTSDCSIKNGTHLIITSYENVTYEVSSLELTFQNPISTDIQPPDDDVDEPEQGGNTNNTVVLTNSGNSGYDSERKYSACKYNFYFDLSEYAGRKITKIDIAFHDYPNFQDLDGYNGDYNILIDSETDLFNHNIAPDFLKIESDFYNCYRNENSHAGCTYDKANNILTYTAENENSIREINDNDYLVFSVGRETQKLLAIKGITVTFADSGNSGDNGNTNITDGKPIYFKDVYNQNIGSGSLGKDDTTTYAQYQYSYYYALKSYEDKVITNIEIEFESEEALTDIILVVNPIKDNNNALIKAIDNNPSQGMTYSGKKFTYTLGSDNYYLCGWRQLESNDYLVIAGQNNFTINSVTVTLADSIHNIDYKDFTKSPYEPDSGQDDKIKYENVNSITPPSDYSKKRITKIESYFYNRQNCQGYTDDYNTWKAVYNLMLIEENVQSDNDITTDEGWDWDNKTNIYTKKINYKDNTQGKISRLDIKTPYPDHLEKVVVYFNDGCSTYTVMNNKFGKIDYSASMEFKGATYDESTKEMTGGDTNYIVADYSPTYDSNKPYVGKTVKNIQFYFHGLAENDRNNGELYKHTLNVYGREYKDGDNWVVVNANSSSWSGDILTTTYPSVVVTGFSVRTRYPNNLEKVLVNYTDGSTFTLCNSKYTGQYEQVVIPTNQPEPSPDYDTTYVEFLTDTGGTNVEIYDKFVSKEVDYVEMYFKNQLTEFPNDGTFNVWLKASNWDNVGTHAQAGYSDTATYENSTYYVAKWEYSNATNAKYIGVRTTDNTEVKLVKITYTDGSTFTVVNNLYNTNTPTGKEEIVRSYDFVDSTDLRIEKENDLDIPPRFFESKTVVSIEAYFENLDTFGTLNSKSILDIWVSGGKGEWEWCDLEGLQSVTEKDNIRIEDYTGNPSENRAKLRQIGIITSQYHQNLNYVVVRFEDESTITIYNNNYYEKKGVTAAVGTASAPTVTPTNGLIEEITLTKDNLNTGNGYWEYILQNQPMVAPDGTVYVYYIIETEIKYKGEVLSGMDNILTKFDVHKIKECIQLTGNEQEDILGVENSLKLTNVNMPATGGIGTHTYRNAGILMMICSGGIYLSLRALRKKQH